MVAYKKFTKIERANVVNAMVKNIIAKELKPAVKEIEDKLTALFAKNIPDEVLEFEKKYPYLIDKEDITLYGYNFLSREDQDDYSILIKWNSTYPSFTVKNIYNKMINGIDIPSWHIDEGLISYIKENEPDIMKKIKTIIVRRLELEKWSDNLDCTLSAITTINKLKEEFLEAYSVYAKLYNEPKSCKKVKGDKGNETSMCDNIEKLRAEYNKVVDKDNKEVDNK